MLDTNTLNKYDERNLRITHFHSVYQFNIFKHSFYISDNFGSLHFKKQCLQVHFQKLKNINSITAAVLLSAYNTALEKQRLHIDCVIMIFIGM